jgi:hypothetical protein
MMRPAIFCALACAVALSVSPAPARADLQKALKESNLEKRSKLALENATDALEAAREAYTNGDNAGVSARAAEITASVELAQLSLEKTGKNPRRSPKWFKRAEIATRDLVRKIETFQQAMSYTDRHLLDQTKTRIQEVHDQLLLGLMEGKKK